MADAPVIHIGENSPEHVAYSLLRTIATVEKKKLNHESKPEGGSVADRKWILDTYAECIMAVRTPASRQAYKPHYIFGYGSVLAK